MQRAPVAMQFDKNLNPTSSSGGGSLQIALRRSFEEQLMKAENALRQVEVSKEIVANKPSNMSDAEMMEHEEWVDLAETIERRKNELEAKIASLDIDQYEHRRNIAETKYQKRARIAAARQPEYMEFDLNLNPTAKASTPLQKAHTEYIEQNVIRAQAMLSKIQDAAEKVEQMEQSKDMKLNAEYFELLEYVDLKDTVERHLSENLAKLGKQAESKQQDESKQRRKATKKSSSKEEKQASSSTTLAAGLGVVGCLGLVGSCLGLGYMMRNETQHMNTTVPAETEQEALSYSNVPTAAPVATPALTL